MGATRTVLKCQALTEFRNLESVRKLGLAGNWEIVDIAPQARSVFFWAPRMTASIEH